MARKKCRPFRTRPQILSALPCPAFIWRRCEVGGRLLRTEGIAYRGSDAKYVIGMEFEIIVDVVVMGFGTDEECLPDVIAYAYTGVEQEMCVIDIGAAAATVGAVGLIVEKKS